MSGTPAGTGRTDLVEPEQWYAQLPTTYAATGALITDPVGNVLLVKPNYRDHWALPGGIVDHNEPPEAACAREISEELGISLPAGRLLIIDWAPAYARRPRPITYFLFDGGVIDPETSIRLQYAELDEYAFADPGRIGVHLDPHTAARIPAALAARADGTTIYLPQA